MALEQKRIFVEMVGRLGRETQLHLDERHRHFRVTDMVIITMSVILLIIAMFNISYITVLNNDLDGIIHNMESMHSHLKGIRGNMHSITSTMGEVDEHMAHMDSINANTEALMITMPEVRAAMQGITGEVSAIERDMGLMAGAMTNMDQRLHHMTGGVSVMRDNVRQISRPMGFMNPVMP